MSVGDRVKAGDWVLVHGKVTAASGNGVDVIVELFSKTDQFDCAVRRDLIVDIVAAPIPAEPDGGSVALFGTERVAWQRVGQHWARAGGGDERRSWVALCQSYPEPVIVHHA